MAVSAGVTGGASLGTLFVRLTANATDLIRGMNQAETSVDKSSGVIIKRLGIMGMAVAGTMTAIGVAAVKTFSDFEDSFTGVRKTVDAGEHTMVKLADSFRQMAREGHTGVNEINRVAEAAGSLGIQTGAITDFTKTMIQMGQTTNLASDEAATEMARFANITGMSQDQFDEMGSTLVDLGNKLAATEKEIMNMGLRIAGAGSQVGLAEHEILALAGALSSVGIEAEMGGTAISQALIRMSKAVSTGSEELDVFARAAGMSSQDFQKAFKDDAANALLSFLTGLKGLSDQGEDVFTMLEQMGIDGSRLTDTVMRASGAQKLFNDALKIGKNAWEENNALTEEADKRAQTLSSQWGNLKNILTDMLISLGEGIVPAVRMLVDEFREWTKESNLTANNLKWFGEMMGSTFYAAVKSVVEIIYGVRDAFKVMAIGVADGVGYILGFWNNLWKGVKWVAENVVNSFNEMINVIIRGANHLISKLPAGVKKLLGLEGDDLQHGLIPEVNFKVNLGGDSFLKEWSDQMHDAADIMSEELMQSHIPQAALKRSTEEVKEEALATASGYEEMVKQINAASNAQKSLKPPIDPAVTAENERLKRLFKDMPSAKQVRGPMTAGFGFGSSDLQDAFGMRSSIQEAEENLKVLAQIKQRQIDLKAEEKEELLALEQAYHDNLKKLRQAEYELAVVSAKTMFGDLATIAEAFAGQQSGIYKAMFAASKAFAIAESIIKIQQGIAGAAALPWPANLAAIASVVAATANIVSTIQSVKLEFGGKREKGGSVFAGSAYLVGEKGPELFAPGMNGSIIPNTALGANVQVNVVNQPGVASDVKTREEDGQTIIDIVSRRVKNEIVGEVGEGRGDMGRALARTYNLKPVGR
jgi:TP901 family phage tail tape measure protein